MSAKPGGRRSTADQIITVEMPQLNPRRRNAAQLASLLAARAQLLEFLARRSDLKAVRLHRKPQAMADFVFDLFDFVAVELHDFFAILTNDVVVVRMLGVIRIVKLVILAEIHFANQAAFGQERQSSVYSCSRNRLVPLARPFEQLFRRKMLFSAENRIDDRLPLRGQPQIFLLEKINKSLFRTPALSLSHRAIIGHVQ